MKKIGTNIKETPLFLKREDVQKNILRKLNLVREQVKIGGGEKAIERHKAKGKLTARERIDLLLDDLLNWARLLHMKCTKSSVGQHRRELFTELVR